MDAVSKGPRNLITDVTGLRVGNAQDDHIKTGTTVLVWDGPFTASVHVNTVDIHFCVFHNSQNMRYLMNRYPEFRINMTY